MIRKLKIDSIFKNADIIRLIENFSSLAILKICNLIIPFIMLPYLIKTLGFEQYGVIVLALSFFAYFQTITDYGFNLFATREVALHRHSKNQLSLIYSKIMQAKLFLLLCSFILMFSIMKCFDMFFEYENIYFMLFPMLLGHSLFPEWFFRGVEEMMYIAILNLVVKLSLTSGVFLFIDGPDDTWIYIALQGCGFLIVSIISHFIIFKKFKIRMCVVGFNRIFKVLISSFPMFINQFIPNFYNNTTNFFVGIILGNYSAGIFGSIRQIVALLNVFDSTVSMVFFSFLNRRKNMFNIYSKYYIGIFSTILIFTLLLHEYMFKVLHIDNSDSFLVLLYLLFGIFFIVIYNVYSTNYLLIYKLDKVVMKITICSSLFGFVFAYPLINNWGIVGGAANIAISQFLMGTLSYYYYLFYKNKGVSL